jgi:hypothetical protein
MTIMSHSEFSSNVLLLFYGKTIQLDSSHRDDIFVEL